MSPKKSANAKGTKKSAAKVVVVKSAGEMVAIPERRAKVRRRTDLRDADLAMYAAKAAGKARHEFFVAPAPPAIEEPAVLSEEPAVPSEEPVVSSQGASVGYTAWPASWE